MDEDDLDFAAFRAWAAAVVEYQRRAYAGLFGDELGVLRDRVARARSHYEIASEAQERIRRRGSDRLT